MLARALPTAVALFGAAACHASSASPPAPAPSSSASAAPSVAASASAAPSGPPSSQAPLLESATLPLIRARSGREMLLPLYFAASDDLGAKLTPTHVLFDTGSSGLHVLASVVPPALVKRTGKRDKHVYPGTGVVFEGEEATAKVRIGPDAHHLIEMDITVDLIDLVGCVPEKRNCWGKDGAAGMQSLGYAGILGVGTRAVPKESAVFSPFAQLPANYASGYIVSVRKETVTVGLTPDAEKGFARFKLPVDPSRPLLPDGAPAWDDSKLPVCTSFPGTKKAADCALTLLASSRSTIVWNTGKLPAGVARGGHLKDGTTVEIDLANVFTWTTGLTRDETEVGGAADTGGAARVLGLPFFRDHDVLYDLRRGELGVRDAPSP